MKTEWVMSIFASILATFSEINMHGSGECGIHARPLKLVNGAGI